MFDESQVQDDGWQDATDETDRGRGFGDRISNMCKFCGRRRKVGQRHIAKCSAKFRLEEEGIKYVICALCGLHGKSLSQHLKKDHGINPVSYDGQLTCNELREERAKRCRVPGGLLGRMVANGGDLGAYKRKMSASVSNAIISSPKERKRRSDLLKSLNKTKIWTPEFKAMMTEKSKRTAARPDIIARRTENLKRWREVNFDEFYEKCIKVMLSCWHSKPELALFELVSKMEGYTFKNNQFVKSEMFVSRSKRKQVDIADSKMRVYIEFDGPRHFKNINGRLEEIVTADKLLDEHVERHGWTLIRVSFDQWSGQKFNDECLLQLFEILRAPKTGVIKIGKAYESRCCEI